jgi:hypothetical protein
MRTIFFFLFLFTSTLVFGSKDSISFEIKFINMMTGSSAIYRYQNERVIVFKSKKDSLYRFVSKRRVTKENQYKINNSIIQLISDYEYRSNKFRNLTILDGFYWEIKINLNNRVITYEVLNCYNRQLDRIIQLTNDELKSEKLIFETGLMYKSKNSNCE